MRSLISGNTGIILVECYIRWRVDGWMNGEIDMDGFMNG